MNFAGGAVWSPKRRLLLAAGLVAIVMTALAVGWLVHRELFVTPRGEYIGGSLSPTGEWRVSLYYIDFGAGASEAWRAEVMRVSPEASRPRDIYVGGAAREAMTADLHWASDTVVVINGHHVDVTGPGYGQGPLLTGFLWLVYWLLTIGAGLLVAVVGAAAIIAGPRVHV